MAPFRQLAEAVQAASDEDANHAEVSSTLMSTETRIPADHAGNVLSVKMASRFAYGAGYTGILGNLFLIAMYGLLGLLPAGETLLGSAFQVAGSARETVGWYCGGVM